MGTVRQQRRAWGSARSAWRGAWAALVLGGLGCGSSESAAVRWEVAVDGCVWRGPELCERGVGDPARLVVWVGARPDERVELWAGEQRVVGQWSEALVGFTGAVALPESAAWVELRRSSGQVEASRRFRVAVAVEQAAVAPLTGPFAEALARANTEGDAVSAGTRARWQGQLARLALAEGEVGVALSHAAAAIEGLPEEERDLAWVRDVSMYVFLATSHGGDLALARATLEQAARHLAGELPAVQAVAWSEGLLALHVGNLRAAERHLERSLETSKLLLRPARWARASADQLVNLYLAEGRYTDAIALLSAPPGEEDGVCELARWHGNVGYALWRAERAGEQVGARSLGGVEPAAEAQLQRALGLARIGCEAAPDGLLSTLYLNLALVAVSAGEAEAAGAYADLAELHGARAVGVGAAQLATRVELELVRGEVALATGGLEAARAAFDAVASLSAETGWIAARLQALHGLARTDERAGEVAAALQRYAEAERLALSQVHLVPITAGRDAFLAHREAATRSWVELLLREGRAGEALTVMRTLRAQFLDSLGAVRRLEALSPAAQARWDEAVARYHRQRAEREQVAAGAWRAVGAQRAVVVDRARALDAQTWELLDEGYPTAARLSAARRAPEPGEAIVAWMPLHGGSWVGWVLTVEGVRVVRTERAEPAELLAAALPLLGGAQRVTLLPYGPLRHVDLHLVPLPGGALLERLPVSWALDLAEQRAVLGPVRSALVVDDPGGDLPWARAEGAAVRDSLAGRVSQVGQLHGRAAGRSELLAALGVVDLLHFAGHASFGGAVGDGALLLAEEARLTVPDVLTASRVPARVVLSGCETGRSAASAVENLGMAQAFVAAGAGAVVATVRKVDDALAAQVTEALYAAGFDHAAPERAFREALLAVKAREPGADVAAFRLFVP